MQLDLIGNQKSGGAERAIHASGGGIILRSNMPEGKGIYSGGGDLLWGGGDLLQGGGFTSGGGGGGDLLRGVGHFLRYSLIL